MKTASWTGNRLRWSVPVITGRRGAGLGNEIIPWAKAFLAAQECSLRLAHPAWSLNPRGYRRDFASSRFDWPLQRLAASSLPTLDVDGGMVRATGHDDYGLAMSEIWRGLPPNMIKGPLLIRHVSRMEGGFFGIRRARNFVLRELLRPPGVVEEVYRNSGIERSESRLRIALHIRAGDFLDSDRGPLPGEFNRRVPPEWYIAVCRELLAIGGDEITFEIFTDERSHPSIGRMISALGRRARLAPAQSPLADLVAMSRSDAIICSVSSFSMLAVFISDRPYIWYGPHLGKIDGWRGLWAFDTDQQTGRTALNAQTAASPLAGDVELLTRGVSSSGDGSLPNWFLPHLKAAAALRDSKHDLIHYGVVR